MFRVSLGTDVTEEGGELLEALWEVVDGWAPVKKRKFIKFVTGVSTLPAPGSEVRVRAVRVCWKRVCVDTVCVRGVTGSDAFH